MGFHVQCITIRKLLKLHRDCPIISGVRGLKCLPIIGIAHNWSAYNRSANNQSANNRSIVILCTFAGDSSKGEGGVTSDKEA